jgi:hypothetical protein
MIKILILTLLLFCGCSNLAFLKPSNMLASTYHTAYINGVKHIWVGSAWVPCDSVSSILYDHLRTELETQCGCTNTNK